MIEAFFMNIGWVVLGAVIGAIVMFFVAQKNPEWVSKTYGDLKAKEKELRELKEKNEIATLVEQKVKEVLGKKE